MTDTLGPYTLNEIYTGDAIELTRAIPNQSVDLIFTDPPYLKGYMYLYKWLSNEAPRILKPNGFLLMYAGIFWKDEIMAYFRDTMQYFWDMVLVSSGRSSVMWDRKILARHKSILVYTQRGARPKPRTMALSLWRGSGKDKRFHSWGQDESSARYYIDCFSKPEDIVIDPFCGGGTTPAMCKVIGRRYLSFEVDPATADNARARVINQQMPLDNMPAHQAEIWREE